VWFRFFGAFGFRFFRVFRGLTALTRGRYGVDAILNRALFSVSSLFPCFPWLPAFDHGIHGTELDHGTHTERDRKTERHENGKIRKNRKGRKEPFTISRVSIHYRGVQCLEKLTIL
jgi:hypothetical protein